MPTVSARPIPMRPRGRVVAALLLGAALGGAALGSGCKINSVAQPVSCISDDQCGSGLACMGGACITHGVKGTWAIELLPTSDSTAAPTQISSVSFSDSTDVTVLKADSKTMVMGDLVPAGSSLAGNSHVIATVQTAIPGHADLQLETDWLVPVGVGQPPPFSLTVPSSTIGQDATFRISPLPPRDLAQPPVTIGAKLAAAVDLQLVNNSYYVTGRLVTPIQALQSGFVARAFESGQLVSNVSNVNTNSGDFRLEIPADPAYATSGRPITVEVTPAGSQYSTPRFVTPTIVVHGNTDVGDLTLPSTANANLYRFKVVDPDRQPIVGAIVRVRTVLASSDSGVADFLRDGSSDVNGNADLALLPGTAQAVQTYDVSVIPPTGSRFGIACMNGVAIASAGPDPGAGEPPVTAWLQLPAKATLTGTLLSADGLPVSGAAISATRTAADTTTNCASSIVSPPAGASSDKNGNYQLLLDPGTYRFDYDPPAGAPVPRLTETGVLVTATGNNGRTVQMRPGALLKGAVRSSTGTPLSFVGVRFFDIACSGRDACYGKNRIEPILRADTHTDSDGNFRAVVPVQLPSP